MKRQVVLYILIGGSALLLGGGFGLYWTQIRPLQLYRDKSREIARQLLELEQRPPAGISPHGWEELAKLTNTAFGNVFFDSQHASYSEMLRFQADLDERLSSDRPVRVETLRWIWRRLGETGPHGREYTSRCRPLFEEGAAQLVPRRD